MNTLSRPFRLGLMVLVIGMVPVQNTLSAPVDTGGMQRIGALTLSSGSYSSLYNALIDPVNGYAYFSTAHMINPGWITKVDITGALPVEVGATQVMTGEFNLIAGAIDVGAGYAYFGTTSSPGQVIKIALGSGSAPPTYVGSLTLNSGENSAWGMVIDTRDADPANHYIYVATATSPGRIVKVAPGIGNALPTRVASLPLQAGENSPRRAVVDLMNGYAYFGTMGVIPKVIKIGLTSGNTPPTHQGTATLEITLTHNLGSAVIDPTNGYAYFGTYDLSLPAKVYKVALGAGSTAPSLVGALTLNSGERELSTAVIDPANGYAYFGTDHTYPGKIYQIQLGLGSTLPTKTGTLPLQGGTQPNPPDGQNVINNPETLYGEVFLQSSVIDLGRGYAYFGTDSNHGQVVKVALPSLPITDLHLVNALAASGTLTATLAWTPPVNAITTTLRYSDSTITEATWANALLLTDTLTGTATLYTATVPYTSGTLYFALKTQDLIGNYSALSNNVFWPYYRVELPLGMR